MRLIQLLPVATLLLTSACLAQSKTPAYGQLFSDTQQQTIPPVAAMPKDTNATPAYPVTTKNKTPYMQNQLLPPTIVVPSPEPATFEQHAEDAQRVAEHMRRQQELERQARLEAEKANANKPTVIVVQPPPPEASLLNVLTAIPTLFMRGLFK